MAKMLVSDNFLEDSPQQAIDAISKAISAIAEKDNKVDFSGLKDTLAGVMESIKATHQIIISKEAQIDTAMQLVEEMSRELIRLKSSKLDELEPLIKALNNSNNTVVTTLDQMKNIIQKPEEGRIVGWTMDVERDEMSSRKFHIEAKAKFK